MLLFHLLPHYEAIAALFPRPLLTAFSRWFSEKSIESEIIACVGTFVGSMILAKVSWVLFEHPIHGLKESFFPSQPVNRSSDTSGREEQG